MISMTGYSYNEVQEDNVSCSVEIRSVNNRFLDLSYNLPSSLASLEPELKELFSGKIHRGKVDVSIRYFEKENTIELSLDEQAVSSYLAILTKLKEIAHLEEPITLAHLQAVDGLILSSRRIDVEKAKQLIFPLVEKSLLEFLASRKKEGEATLRDIQTKILIIKEKVVLIATYAESIEQRIKENLLQRFEQLLGDQIDMQRIYAETAIALVKLTINEELQRLHSHLDSFTSLLLSDDPVGKKLDFLLQEMNREINTIGSKNTLLEVANEVVAVKDALEQIREQIRNVE